MARKSILEQVTAEKVAIYVRVSTVWQIDKDSLQVQKRELSAYCEMVLGIKDYVIFEDPGYSAKNTDRPAYQQMMDRLRTGEFSHILVWKIDRISRNLLDFATMYAELKQLGVTFVSKNEQFDTSSAIGEAMLKIILIFAELERNMTSERVTAVMLSRATNGQWNGGRVPCGYDWDKEQKTFTINAVEGKIVKMIYNMYEEHQSLIYVSRYLNEKKYTTKNGKEWSPTTVHKILSNPFYIGTYIYNVHEDGRGTKKREDKEWITFEEHHEPIVTHEQFDRVQFLLQRNRRGGVQRGGNYERNNVHIFGGLVKCGVCGSLMSATLDKRRADGWRPSIYGCSRRRKNSKACSNKYISDAVIGPFVFNYIANIIRAKNSGKKFDLGTLQKRLLQGTPFFFVESISEGGLSQLNSLFEQGESGLEYKPSFITEIDDVRVDERDMLLNRKHIIERAINRLRQLYMFGDEETPEAEYILERKKLTDELAGVDARLNELSTEDKSGPITDESFIKKASYFIMVEKLLDKKTIDYEKYIRGIEATIPRNFVQSVVERIEVTDGNVSAIVFKNGMRHEFTYKK